MSIVVQHRRDSNTNVEANTPAAGELWMDTTKGEATIGNGTTAAGIRQQKKNIREGLAPAQITANTNDYNPTGLKHAAVLELTTDASHNLTGMVPTTPVDTTDGRQIVLYNNGSFNLVVQDQNATSVAANRFDLGGADITLAPKQSVTLRYNLTATRWQIMAGTYGQSVPDNAISARKLAASALGAFSGMINGTLVESHTGNAATFAVKTLAGNDPSTTDPVYFVFRDATAAAGDFVVRTVTAALNFTISAGSSMGFTNGVAGRVWLTAHDNAGTVLLGAINCFGANGPSIFNLSGFGIASTTAEGGAGAADAAQTFYTASALTSKAYSVLGYASYETGLVTAGNWAASPTRLQLYGPGVPLPGTEIQRARVNLGAVNTGTTIIPHDNTIPQNTEGDQYLSQAITPTSACNLLDVSSRVCLSNTGAGYLAAALFQDSVASALAAIVEWQNTFSAETLLSLDWLQLAGVNVSTTFKVRGGGHAAGTTTFNGNTGNPFYGGVMNSYLAIKELMG